MSPEGGGEVGRAINCISSAPFGLEHQNYAQTKFVRNRHNYAMLRYKSARDPDRNPVSILDDHHLSL